MTIDTEAPEFKKAVEEAAKKLAEDEAGGLKKKVSELMDELKDHKRKFDGVDADEYRQLKGEKKKGKDKESSPEEIRASVEAEFKPLVEKANKEREDAVSELKALKIDSALTGAMAEAKVGGDFMEAAKALLKSQKKFDVTESGATVDGQPVADFIKKWVEGDGKKFVAAPDNSGGGANNGKSGGGAAGKQKRSEMSVTDKVEYVKQHGQEAFNALPA